LATAVVRVGDAAIEKGGAGCLVVVGGGTASIEVRQDDGTILVIVGVVDEVVAGPTSVDWGEGSRRMKAEALVGQRDRKWRSVDDVRGLGEWMMVCWFSEVIARVGFDGELVVGGEQSMRIEATSFERLGVAASGCSSW